MTASSPFGQGPHRRRHVRSGDRPTRARHRDPPVVAAFHAMDERGRPGRPRRFRGGPRSRRYFDPVQYSVRLLVPDGSLLLAEPAMTTHLGGYDPTRLGWTWTHPDPAVTIFKWTSPPWSRPRSAKTPSGPSVRLTGYPFLRIEPPERPARGAASSVLEASEPGSPNRGFAAPNQPRPSSPR